MKQNRSFLEPLEARIAPATLVNPTGVVHENEAQTLTEQARAAAQSELIGGLRREFADHLAGEACR